MKKENKTFKSILEFLYKLNGFTILGLFLFSLVLLSLFIFGNYHNFSDTRQSIFLKHISFFVILIDFLCVFGVIESILLLIFDKIRFSYFLIMFLQIIMFAVCLTLLGFSEIVENLSGGLYLGLAYVK